MASPPPPPPEEEAMVYQGKQHDERSGSTRQGSQRGWKGGKEEQEQQQDDGKREELTEHIPPVLTVALVGRPNTGKSSIWNRLVTERGTRKAIVSEMEGTTRDRREGVARLGEMTFKLVDTGGLDSSKNKSPTDVEIVKLSMRQTEAAAQAADVILFCVDGKAGVTRDDESFARWIKTVTSGQIPIVLLANKIETRIGRQDYSPQDEFAKSLRQLKLGEPLLFSATQNIGLGDMFRILNEFHEKKLAAFTKEKDAGDNATQAIKLCILGRPNVGKSTLLNTLVGQDRVAVGPMPGLTRDSVSVEWVFQNQHFRIIDTAGIRHKAISSTTMTSPTQLDQVIERESVTNSLRALNESHVAALVLDLVETGTGSDSRRASLSKQDLVIAGRVVESGRPLIVIANKVDRIAIVNSTTLSTGRDLQSEEEFTKLRDWVRDEIERSVPNLTGTTVFVVSALNNKNLSEEILPTVLELKKIWNKRIPTSAVVRWLRHITQVHAPPVLPMIQNSKLRSHARLKVKYGTQVSTQPPTFAFFVNRRNAEDAVPAEYKRFLINSLSKEFGFGGVPVRIVWRSSANPFADKPPNRPQHKTY